MGSLVDLVRGSTSKTACPTPTDITIVKTNNIETKSINIRKNTRPFILGDGFQFISLGSVFSPPKRVVLFLVILTRIDKLFLTNPGKNFVNIY